MSLEFSIATENLYKAFSIYSLNSTIEGCPCCVSGTDKERLHSKQLRDLQGDDLERYAFKALSTWGDLEDFKHYLPRIFELTSTSKLLVDTFVVLGKLTYGNWTTWPDHERIVVQQFLHQ